MESKCPCGSHRPYDQCCRPYHEGTPAPTAEALMRSRYSAYVLRLEAYLLATWHPSTRPASLDFGDEQPPPTWLGLKVQRHHLLNPDEAEVEFVARFRLGGSSAQRLHECSRFQREQGRWYYLDGRFPSR